MSQFDLDLGYQYKSLRSRSNSIKSVENAAKARGAEYSELGSDFFNALFQKHPQLKSDIDSENKYNQIIRALSQSEKFQQIRAQTKGNLNWSAIGAAMLLDEISKVVNLSDEEPPDSGEDKSDVKPDKENKEETEKEESEKDQDGSEESEESDDNSDSGESSESDNEDDKSDSDDSSGGSQSKESSDSDESESDDMDDSDNSQGEDDSEESFEEDGESEDSDSLDNGEGLDEELDEFDDEDFEEESLEQGPPKPINEAIQDALDKAAEKMQEMITGIKAGSGGSIPGGDAKMVDDYVRLSTNPNLVKLMRMVGRLKLDNNFLSALSDSYPEESMGVTIGNNIQRTLPRDLVNLTGNDDEFMVFMNKYTNRELLQRKYKSNARPGKGPMIVCVDVSSSMATDKRYEWAQTIAAAMYTMAHKENRAFAVVPYNSTSRLYDAKPTGKAMDINLLASILGLMPSGGTNFDSAWRTAIQFMRKNKASKMWKNSDIVFITDGECALNKDEWLKDKGTYNVRLFSFVLGMDEAEARAVYNEEYFAKNIQNASYYQSFVGRPVHETVLELEKVSDAICFVEKIDVESGSQAFSLVKSAQQKRGQMVR